MAQLGFSRVGALVAVLVLGACGGRVDELGPSDDGGGIADDFETGRPDGDVIDAPDDAPPVHGFRSYTATVKDVAVDWGGWSPPEPGEAPPLEGFAFRIDLDAGLDRDGGVLGVVAAPFTDAVPIRGCCAGTVTLRADGSKPFVQVGGGAPYSFRRDALDAITITFGKDGRPLSAKVTGIADASRGDVAYSGKLRATITFTPDATRPTFAANAATPFASVALPWDERRFETSEPYEEAVATAELLGSSIAMHDVPLTQTGWGGFTRQRGVRFRLRAWDDAGSITVYPRAELHDLAGNGAVGKPAPFSDAVSVARHATPTLRFGDAETWATWGAAKVVTTGCESAKSCLAIGPFRWSYCVAGSQGGIAARLPGGGKTSARVRVVATRASTYGGGAVGTPLVHLESIALGQPEPATTALPTPADASDDGWDSGWTTLTVANTKAVETGVAISAGGLGAPSAGCGWYGGPPAPLEWDVTVYVDRIAIAP